MGSEWRECTLGEVIELKRGYDLPKRLRQPGTVPIISSSGVSDFHSVSKVNGAGVVTGRYGTIGQVFYSESDFWPLNTTLYVQNFKGNIPRFIYYFLKIIPYAQYSDKAAVPGVNRNHLHRAEVNLPPLKEQKAIAHVLGSLDDKIELNRQMNTTLEKMAQALFKSWFVDFDPVLDNALVSGNEIPPSMAKRAETRKQALNDGTANRQIAKDFPDSFYFTDELGWVPVGWSARACSDAITINPKVKLSKGSVAPFVDMKALPTSGYQVSRIGEKPYSGGAKFQQRDVLLARITPCLENGKTAVVDFLPDADSVAFGSTEFIVLREKGNVNMPFIACLARDEKFRAHCMQSMVGSSGRQRVQNACFDAFHLALPTTGQLLERFALITEAMFSKLTRHRQQSQSLTKLRDTLLPKLISGELRIPDAEKRVEAALT